MAGAPLGNDNRRRPFTRALKLALERRGRGDYDRGLAQLATKLVSQALKGEAWAIREVYERLDGKVPTSVTGEDGGPVIIKMTADDAKL